MLCLISMLHEDLILNYKTTNFKNLIEELSHILYKKGYVKESYTSAILEREKQFPTGLKTPGINIAMPHTYPEHVIKPAILVATLESVLIFSKWVIVLILFQKINFYVSSYKS